jgi:hypothetical protein
MDSKKPDIDELLSGMLDGRLSIAESKVLEAELAKHPERNAELDQLAALRSSLLRGRPTGKLGQGFASSVTAAARARADQMGADAPEWLRSDSPPAKRASPAPEYHKRFWFAVSTVSAVAALAVIFLGLMKVLEPRAPDPGLGIAQLPLEPEKPTEQDRTGFETESGENLQPDKPKTLIAEAPEKSSKETKVETVMEPSPAVKPSETEPMEVAISRSPEPKESLREKADVSGLNLLDDMDLLTVYEVWVDPKAKERNIVEFLLKKHGLGEVSDFSLNESQMQELYDSQIAGPIDPSGVFQCLFLKSSSGTLDDFYMDMMAGYDDFPMIGMNIVVGEPAKGVLDEFESIPVEDRGVRRLGRATPQGFVSTFSPNPAHSIVKLSVEERLADVEAKRLAKAREPGGDMNPNGMVVLLLVHSMDK